MNQAILSIIDIQRLLAPVFEAAPIYRAVLFGSYAKGTPTEKSDIDIVINSKGELLNIAFYGLLEDVSALLNKRIDLFEVTELSPSIRSAVEEDGIVIFERGFEDIKTI